jgi:hypothetical protein
MKKTDSSAHLMHGLMAGCNEKQGQGVTLVIDCTVTRSRQIVCGDLLGEAVRPLCCVEEKPQRTVIQAEKTEMWW